MTMETVRLTIGGMSCSHCQHAVEQALRRQRGVRSATVDLHKGAAEVEYDPAAVSPDTLTSAVEEEGYAASVA
jgi:copper chaperone CopZ